METHLFGDMYFSDHLKRRIFYLFIKSNHDSFPVWLVRPPGGLALIFQIQLELIFSACATLNTFSPLTDINSA